MPERRGARHSLECAVDPTARRPLLWLGVFVSLFGSGMSAAATGWYVLERTGSTVAVGLLWVLITAPGLLVPALGGVLIDRSDRRLLHVALDAGRGLVVVATAALLLRRPGLGLPAVYVLFTLLGAGWTIGWPNLAALVQERTPPERLVRANAIYQVSVQAGMMAAGALVGFLYNALGLAGILLLDGLSYFASAACLAALPAVARPEAPAEARHFMAEVREGLAYLRAHRRLMALGAAWACLMGGVLSSTVLLVALAQDVLRAGARGYGYLEGGWATGAVLGGVVSARLARRHPAALPVLAMAVLAVGHAFLPFVTVLVAAVAAQVLFGSCRALGGVAMQSTVMATVPAPLMGRVQSAFTTLSTVLQMSMSLLLGWLAQAVSLGLAFAAVGALYGAGAAAALAARAPASPPADPPA
jgi:DHA3 family macrolide efflux protein-like MFS transporter